MIWIHHGLGVLSGLGGKPLRHEVPIVVLETGPAIEASCLGLAALNFQMQDEIFSSPSAEHHGSDTDRLRSSSCYCRTIALRSASSNSPTRR